MALSLSFLPKKQNKRLKLPYKRVSPPICEDQIAGLADKNPARHIRPVSTKDTGGTHGKKHSAFTLKMMGRLRKAARAILRGLSAPPHGRAELALI